MKLRVDLTGQKFGKLLVLNFSGREKFGQARWFCQCDCGRTHTVRGSHLAEGRIQSCGCMQGNLTHGHTRSDTHTPVYSSWHMMIQRTTNPKATKFALWGGRGIAVCERWRTFENFLADMGPRPKGTSLDRFPDANGNYEPGNARWATIGEQNSHLRMTPQRLAYYARKRAA